MNLWYVLRVTYQRELMAKAKLDELNIENFVPPHKVRVLAGPFEGVEGTFMRVVNGKREKRVVVKIAGVVAIATASLPISLVEKID